MSKAKKQKLSLQDNLLRTVCQ